MVEARGVQSGRTPVPARSRRTGLSSRTVPSARRLPGQRRPPRLSPPLREPSSPKLATTAPDSAGDPPGGVDVAHREGSAVAGDGPSRIIYVREPRDRPELATAVLALVVSFVSGLVLGGSGVLIWDSNKHTDACAQVGPHVVWDQSAYRCVHQPTR